MAGQRRDELFDVTTVPGIALSKRRAPWPVALVLALLPWGAAAEGPCAESDADTRPPTILVVGDSLSSAFGMPVERGWVALVAGRVARRCPRWQVVNASITGLGSQGAVERLPSLLATHSPRLTVIALGANDALLARKPSAYTQARLGVMTEAAARAGSAVLLVGMQLPPGMPGDMRDAFARVFPEVASEHGIPFLPSLLEPLAGVEGAFLPDGLHPAPDVQDRIARHVEATLAPLLEELDQVDAFLRASAPATAPHSAR